MSIYDLIRIGQVDPIIREYGVEMTLTKSVQGNYDPASGNVTPNTPSESSITGLEVEYQPSEIDGTLVKVGDKRVFIVGDPTVFTQEVIKKSSDYTITLFGEIWPINKLKPVGPVTSPILIEANLRR